MTSYRILWFTGILLIKELTSHVIWPPDYNFRKDLLEIDLNSKRAFTDIRILFLKWYLNTNFCVIKEKRNKRSLHLALNTSLFVPNIFQKLFNNVHNRKQIINNYMPYSLSNSNNAKFHGNFKNNHKFRKRLSTQRPDVLEEQNANNVTTRSHIEDAQDSAATQVVNIGPNHDIESNEMEVHTNATKCCEGLANFTSSITLIEEKLYEITFNKLLEISPENRRKNGFSFVQSGLLLYVALLGLSTEVDPLTKAEIYSCLRRPETETNETIFRVIDEIVSQLPVSSDELTFRWSFRLVLAPDVDLSQEFRDKAASAWRLHIHQLNTTVAPNVLANSLNKMVEIDSGNSMHNTFEADELSDGIRGVLLTTMYLRGRWRSAPTLLNGTMPFLDGEDAGAPQRYSRMIRINDLMKYSDLQSWGAEAIEINYATKGLSLLIIVPKDRLLAPLVHRLSNSSLHSIINAMQEKRIAITMPLYTLRMTLLLPNKLRDMGITRLVDTSTKDRQLKLSHAVQRIMFWSEAGRNAFKDDGIEWDDRPEKEVLVNRPYVFYVRWNNLTLMNGNFAL